jgi:uncharacterized protein (DUF924 family)
MHAESLLANVAVKALLDRFILGLPVGSEDRAFLENATKTSAQEHLDIIMKFGRYPSRNKVLGRESTPEELEHIRQNPDGFAKAPPEANA